MKTNVKQTIVALIMFTLLFVGYQSLNAQTLTVHPKITLDDKSCFEKITVVIVDLDTTEVHQNITLTVIKGFTYTLDDNKDYLIVFSIDGFMSKSVAISTNHTGNDKYLYEFTIDLSDKEVVPKAVKYAGGIFWSTKKGKYDYHIEG